MVKRDIIENYIGMVYGRLTIIGNAYESDNSGRRLIFCTCSCGNPDKIKRSFTQVINSNNPSCGCLLKSIRKTRDNYHGMKDTVTYRRWRGMLSRCNHPTRKSYNYIGISVCEDWKNFLKFYEDMGDCPEGFSLDRIDPTKGYYKENCRWASKFVQSRNKGSYKGSSKYKGVQFDKESNKWLATISVGKYKAKKIGRYLVEETAAKAYNLASEMIFKEDDTYLQLNDLDQDYSNVNMNCKFFKHWVDILREEYLNLYKTDLKESLDVMET